MVVQFSAVGMQYHGHADFRSEVFGIQPKIFGSVEKERPEA
jgi:hypothetical protein